MATDGEGTSPLATLDDYVRRYGTPTEPGRVTALLEDATDALLSEYESYWCEPYREGVHEAFDRSATAVCCAIVHRAVATDGSLAGATQFSQGAGDYSASVTLASPGGDLYVGRSDRRRLGLAGCRVGSIRPMTAADREGASRDADT